MNNYGPIALASDTLQLSVGGRWSDSTLRRLQIQVSERNADGKLLSRSLVSVLLQQIASKCRFFRPVHLRMLR